MAFSLSDLVVDCSAVLTACSGVNKRCRCADSSTALVVCTCYVMLSKSMLMSLCYYHPDSVTRSSRKCWEMAPVYVTYNVHKLTAFVSCSITKLSTWEPLPIYPFHWILVTDLQGAEYYSNQSLCHSWKTPSTLLLWRLHTLINVLLVKSPYTSHEHSCMV